MQSSMLVVLEKQEKDNFIVIIIKMSREYQGLFNQIMIKKLYFSLKARVEHKE